MSASDGWDSYAPPSQFANNMEEAREMIKNGDFWVFDQIGTGPGGEVISRPRAATASDWGKTERSHHAPKTKVQKNIILRALDWLF